MDADGTLIYIYAKMQTYSSDMSNLRGEQKRRGVEPILQEKIQHATEVNCRKKQSLKTRTQQNRARTDAAYSLLDSPFIDDDDRGLVHTEYTLDNFVNIHYQCTYFSLFIK